MLVFVWARMKLINVSGELACTKGVWVWLVCILILWLLTAVFARRLSLPTDDEHLN